MRYNTAYKVLVDLLVGLLASVPVDAACTKMNCLTGPAYCIDQLIHDDNFDQGCAWQYTRYVRRAYVDGDWVAELYYFGSVHQDIVIPAGYHNYRFDLTLFFYSANQSAGTEKLDVHIIQNGILKEHVATFTPSSRQDRWDFTIRNYGDPYQPQTIRLRFRYVEGTNPGGTIFRISSANLFVNAG